MKTRPMINVQNNKKEHNSQMRYRRNKCKAKHMSILFLLVWPNPLLDALTGFSYHLVRPWRSYIAENKEKLEVKPISYWSSILGK